MLDVVERAIFMNPCMCLVYLCAVIFVLSVRCVCCLCW